VPHAGQQLHGTPLENRKQVDDSVAQQARSVVVAPVQAEPEPTEVRKASRSVEDSDLLKEIKQNVVDDPDLSVRLAEEHERLYPNSPNADERDGLLVFAWSNTPMDHKARSAAARYLEKHPNGKYNEAMYRRLNGRSRGEPPLRIIARDESTPEE